MIYLLRSIKFKTLKFTLLTLLLINSCNKKENDFNLESNISYSQIEEKCKSIAKEFDLSIIYYSYNESELRTEYKVLGTKNNQWTKLLFYADFNGNFQKKLEKQLSEQDGRIAILRLEQYDLFNITPEEVLLTEHKKLCGKPRDPSHYLQFSLVLISGKNARKLHFSNPKGRYEMCPAIRQWDNAGKISDFFEHEWNEKN